jgi:polar amino acid transport system substrate-binding protein
MVCRATASFFRVAAAAGASLLLTCLGVAAQTAAPAATAAETVLRICADPDNLPFSAEQGQARGVYVELAELLGQKLALPVQYTWWYTHFQRRAMRNSILANECDAMIALPANADYRHRGVQKSRPFLDVGYAMVAAPGFAVSTLQALKSSRLGVQFSSTPHVLLATLGGFDTVTYKTPEEIFAALAKGEVQAALLWGPVAGYENKMRHQGRWQVTPLAGHDLAGQVVVGVRADHPELKARIDEALGQLQPQIQLLAAKYGFPTGQPLNLEVPRVTSASRAPRLLARGLGLAPASEPVAVPRSLWVAVNNGPAAAASSAAKARRPAASAAASKRTGAAGAKPAAAATAAATATAATVAAAPPLDPVAQAGRVRFNDQCSHCHGSDGASPVRERDVRRLVMRYDADKWQQVALKTIRDGRPDAGMPTWKDTFNEQQMKELLAFLTTIQK